MIGLIGAAFLVGIVIGSLTLTRLGDVHGRHPIFMLGLVMHLGFMAGILVVTNYILCYVLVFIFGLSMTTRYYVGYTYNLEMQPKSHYILVGTSMFVVESVSYLAISFYFMYVSKYWKPLQIPNIVFISAGIVFLCFMPESPRFLISKHRFEDARGVFKWIGKVNGLSREVAERRLNEIVFEGEDREYKDPNPEAAFSTLLKDA
jgi:MFS family permease